MELSPRTSPDDGTPVAPKRRRSPWAYGALVLVLLGLGVVVYQGLTSASLYFYNADEASEQRADLDGKRIRVQGLVRDDVAPSPNGNGVRFTITYNGVDLPVEHTGEPPELFQPGLPVVLEGEFGGSLDAFMSDRIVVKHTEEYEADEGERLEDAEDGEGRGADQDATAP